MAQVTKDLCKSWLALLDAGKHINSTSGEERQLVYAWLKLHELAVPEDVMAKAIEFKDRADDAGFLARALLAASFVRPEEQRAAALLQRQIDAMAAHQNPDGIVTGEDFYSTELAILRDVLKDLQSPPEDEQALERLALAFEQKASSIRDNLKKQSAFYVQYEDQGHSATMASVWEQAAAEARKLKQSPPQNAAPEEQRSYAIAVHSDGTMTDLSRVMTDRDALLILIDALLRKDTEQDGNWGWPSFHAELRHVKEVLEAQPLPQNSEGS